MQSIISENGLWCDAELADRSVSGTNIGISNIKEKRLHNKISSRPGLHVGDCVPFYFCRRSVMLYLFHSNNHSELTYHEGQGPIIHLMADFHAAVEWAEAHGRRWAFTLQNASSAYFDNYAELDKLELIRWEAVRTHNWSDVKDWKQAEFLFENHFPWELIEGIGVYSEDILRRVEEIIQTTEHKPLAKVKKDWYY